MSQNPALVEALARDHAAELREDVQASAAGRRERRRARVVQTARNETGWLLVDIGLRLAADRGPVQNLVTHGER